MSLNQKIALYLLLLGGCLGLGTYGAITLTIIPAFEEFEADATHDVIARADQVLDSELRMLRTQIADYAAWDASYDFARGAGDSRNYVAANFDPANWRRAGADFLLAFGPDGGLLWSTTTERDTARPVGEAEVFGRPMTSGHPILALDETHPVVAGLLPSPHGPLMIAAGAILRNDGSGPAAGTLVVARRIRPAAIEAGTPVAARTMAFLTLEEAGDSGYSREELDAMAAAGDLIHLHRRENVLVGHRLLLDMFGEPLALGEVLQPPAITGIGSSAITAAMTLIAIVVAAFLVFGLVILRQLIVVPVNALSASMQHIRRTGDLDVQIEKTRSDEIGALGREFGEMTTSLHLAQRELEATRDVAIEASRAKSDFLARMSHEIRTPMNGVLGMTELLRNTQLDFEQRRFADTIYVSAESLLEIINDILDFSKIEAGKMNLESRDMNLGSVVEESVDALASEGQRKGLELINDVSPIVHTSVVGDPVRIRQVLTNLVANAIKFTHRGEVVVRATADAVDDNFVDVRLEVIDTGVGIHPDKQEVIFESFAQEDGSTTRMYGGTGLGLAISHQLVQLMGGRLAVESKPGFGSRFYFTLRMPRGSVADARNAGSPQSVAGKRVLVVDDNATNREILEQQFANWRAICHAAADADEAMLRIERSIRSGELYDLLVLDMHMPRVDGLELARRIRGRQPCADIPMLLLSSAATPAREQDLDELKISGQLTKPIRQGQLYDTLAIILGGIPVDEFGPLSTSGAVRRLAGSVLLAEDNAVNQAVALGMLESLAVDVAVVADGQAALRAVAERDFDLVLMDCQMPVLDGLAATRRIREAEARDERPRLPIVALTANAMAGDRERCLEAGMDDYLGKPFTMEQLHAVLSIYLAPPQIDAADAAADRETADEARRAAEDPLDRGALQVLKSLQQPGAPSLVEKVVGIYLESSGDICERLGKAVAAGEAAAVREAAHALKSSSINVGATRLADLCKQLETDAREGRLDKARELDVELGYEYARVIDALREEVGVVTR